MLKASLREDFKMKRNLTELVFILDKSGSMANLTNDTVGGFNAMIGKQKKLDGECIVSCVLFDNDQKVIYDYDESGDHYVTFDTQMKRKNGDVFDRTYSGIEFADILKDLGIEITDDMTVTAVCGDSYEIELTAEEILNPGNVYLVTKENDEELDEESGPFMLVVNYDEFSTRWAKNVVKITVNE